MKRAAVFHLTSGTLTFQKWEQGRLRAALAVDATAEGVACLTAELAHEAAVPALLLVDVPEEEFVVESVPRTFGRERHQFLRRRAERLFPASTARSTTRLRARGEGKGEERLLFTGITHPEGLAPCVNALVAAGIPLRAISSIPHVSARLPQALNLHRPCLLIATVQPGRLRLSYFRDGELCGSRLSAVAAGAPAMMEEFARTRRYLESSGLAPAGSSLAVYLLGEGPLLAELESAAAPDGIELCLCDIGEVASRLGLCYQPAVGTASLFAALFLRTSTNRYANGGQLRNFRVLRIRNFIAHGTLALALLLSLIGLTAADHALEERRSTDRPIQVAAPPKPVAALPDGLTADQFRAAVENAERQSRGDQGPWGALRTLGLLLQNHPGVRLRRIEWVGSPDQRLTELAPETAKTFGLGGAPDALTPPWQGLYMEADVTVDSGALRMATTETAALVRELKAAPGVVGAELAASPVNPEGPLRGSVGRADGPTDSLPFALRAVFRP